MTKAESRLVWAALKWGRSWRKGTTHSEIGEAEDVLLSAYDNYISRRDKLSKSRRVDRGNKGA